MSGINLILKLIATSAHNCQIVIFFVYVVPHIQRINTCLLSAIKLLELIPIYPISPGEEEDLLDEVADQEKGEKEGEVDEVEVEKEEELAANDTIKTMKSASNSSKSTNPGGV